MVTENRFSGHGCRMPAPQATGLAIVFIRVHVNIDAADCGAWSAPWRAFDHVLLEQIKAVDAGQNTVFAAAKAEAPTRAPVTMLLDIKGIGTRIPPPSFGWRRSFAASPTENGIAAYQGPALRCRLVERVRSICEQGVSKSGIWRLRTTLIQLAWRWQAPSTAIGALALWFQGTSQSQWRSLSRRRPSSRWRASCWWRFGSM